MRTTELQEDQDVVDNGIGSKTDVAWSAAGHPIHGSIIFQPQSFGISLVRALGRSVASKIRARAATVSSSKARVWGPSFV